MTNHKGKTWHLASMNDGLFIINAPPRPSTDDIWPDRPDGPSVVLNVTELPRDKAAEIVKVMNTLVAQPPPPPVDNQSLAQAMYSEGYAAAKAELAPPRSSAGKESAERELCTSLNAAELMLHGLREGMATRVAKQWEEKCAEVAALRHDIERHIKIASDLVNDVPRRLSTGSEVLTRYGEPAIPLAIKAIKAWQANRATSYTPTDILIDCGDAILATLTSTQPQTPSMICVGWFLPWSWQGFLQVAPEHEGEEHTFPLYCHSDDYTKTELPQDYSTLTRPDRG